MSSDSEDENAIRYGTPLEPYEEDEVPSKRKYQQPADQYAVDEHGRRRFHGAFTGGFSAGFQNTVGSQEGWTPANFVSSRSEKAQKSSQRPEDFMDEEDRSEFGIAPRLVQTHSEFSGQKRPRQRTFHDGPIPGEPVLEQLLRPVHETAAVRMLKSMGWRPGQGTGERLTKKKKKVYGCYIPRNTEDKPQSEEDSSDSEYDFDTLFAPDDYEPYILARKNDRFGLGYSGLSRHSVLGNLVGEYGSDAGSSRSHLVMKDKGKKVSIRGQAFGVGAFEAEDEDIYASEDMSHYDFAIGGPSKEDSKKKPARKENSVLEGFIRSSAPLPPVPSHPPPALPRGYTPAPAGTRRSRFEPTDTPQRDQGLGRHELTPEARGALLGETPLKPIQEEPIQPPIQTTTPIQPAIQTTTPIQIDPIAKLLGRNVNFVTTNEEPKELDFISIKDSGKELVKVFKPFVSNPQKQARYERFLKDRNSFMKEGGKEMDKLSEWERNREMVEFEQAAKLYRPLTGEMGDRFTHASEPDEAVNPLCAVSKSRTNYGLATAEQVAAAQRGVYGLMTRSQAKWRPEPLVCKRFNIPEPGGSRVEPQKEDKPKVSYSIFSYLESSVLDKESFAKEQSKFSGSKSLSTEVLKVNSNKPIESRENPNATPRIPSPTPSTSETNTGFTKRMTVAELFIKESEKDLKNKSQGVEVTDTIEKFDKMELYKSIFLSDSEEEEEEKSKEATETETVINFDDFADGPKNTERNTSPPRGIFANIDFDELNSWRRKTDDKTPDDKPSDDKATNKPEERDSNSNNANTEKGEETEVEVYGPKIPENLKKRLESTESNPPNPLRFGSANFRPLFISKKDKDEIHEISSSSSDSWVEAKEVKSKKSKKKKSKKHKSKHKKSKHKKKDK